MSKNFMMATNTFRWKLFLALDCVLHRQLIFLLLFFVRKKYPIFFVMMLGNALASSGGS